MARASVIAFALVVAAAGVQAQGSKLSGRRSDDGPLKKLAFLEGTWIAYGDGFSSKLTYEWALPGVLLRGRNELRNAAELFGQYEGHYAWDPALKSIVFWTVGRDGELHRGEASMDDGRLWHKAIVLGGDITGYRSVIEAAGKELHYRARYELAAPDQAVLEGTPLVYRRAER